MTNFIDLLGQGLHKGFVDKESEAMADYQPKLLLNTKSRTVLDDLQRDLQNCDEFWFSVAFLTTDGLAALIETLKELGLKGITGKILVSEYLHFTKPEALKKLLKLNHIQSRIVKHELGFHQKGYMFRSGDQHSIIIGSSNLTASALQVNSELNIRLTATGESQIIEDVIDEFKSAFEQAQILDLAYIEEYEEMFVETEYRMAERLSRNKMESAELVPNKMQEDALVRLSHQRAFGISKSLIISATATGKTILSAFDVKQTGAQRCLFVVHRRNIAIKAMDEFKKVFGYSKTMGLYSGDQKEKDADFVFATIQTISRDQDLNNFKSDDFDYIIIDETHRAGAPTYQKFMDYFRPDFMLGMTATPERGDNFDIFAAFDHNIAYEIRLNGAMENKLVCPFHYYGVTDITVNGQTLEEDSDFNLLVDEERVSRIIEKVEFYGTDDGVTRGLIFCSRVAEAAELSALFNLRGYRTKYLSGDHSEEDRQQAIELLQSNDSDEKLDYIFAVDIFNEGIDIPRINQVVMLRPTDSAIIFVQQLGRGLRLHEDKEYLTVIDFIGNYKNSYLVPIALFGDTTYNKDNLRKLLSSGSTPIPGSSTINFDEISKQRVFDSIDATNMSILRDLRRDYIYLKSMLGRIPMMMDFLEYGSRDPYSFIDNKKSYYNFVIGEEKANEFELDRDSVKLLECFSLHINNAVRIEESILLLELLDQEQVSVNKFKEQVYNRVGYYPSNETVLSCLNNLNFGFMMERESNNSKMLPIGELYGFNIATLTNDIIQMGPTLKGSLQNKVFTRFLRDNTNYSIKEYMDNYDREKFRNGFSLYRKYERKDIFRILNWDQNPVAQNVGGYILSSDKTQFPIFVTYEKASDISDTTKYEDHFVSQTEFAWMSKSRRTISSPEIIWLQEYSTAKRIPLFIKKSDNEGIDFYYMGDLKPDIASIEQDVFGGTNIVKVNYAIVPPVEDSLYQYLTG